MKKKGKNKKVVRKKDLAKEKSIEELKTKSKKLSKEITTLQIINESDIAMDFATKAYKKFNKTIKSIILFGSTMKGTQTTDSDIDLIIIIDDVSIKWDQEIIAWYREELDKILKNNPYKVR